MRGITGEVEGHVALRLVVGAEERGDLPRPLVRLGEQHATRILAVDHGAHPLDVVVRRRLALAVALFRLEEVGDGVEPDAVDAEVHPVAHDVEHGLLHGRVLEVQVGLVREEAVEEELPADRVERPVRLLRVDEDDPDVGVALIGVAPHVVVAVRTLGVGAGLLEPFVLVARVVERVVHDDAHVALVRLGDELAEVVDGAEVGEDRLEVRHVVAAVAEGRLVERRQPERIDAEPLQVVQLRDEALQVAGPVAVRVDERADHHLVEDAPLEPLRVEGKARLLDRCGEAHGSPPGARAVALWWWCRV